jgi:hypothetical protein
MWKSSKSQATAGGISHLKKDKNMKAFQLKDVYRVSI